MMIVNGERRETIEIIDRGFQYGDGLFETIAVINGHPVFLDKHLDRLKLGCQKLNIPLPNHERIYFEVGELCHYATSVLSSNKAIIKLIMTRGSGGRGYRAPDLVNPTRVLSLHSFPDYPQDYASQGISVRFCNTRLGLNPALAGIKHLNRLEQVLARSEWYDPAIQEGIMLDINGYVIEGTMTNLFYVKDGTVYTASLAQSGIAGVMRDLIIELILQHQVSFVEHCFTKDQLLQADEVFVSNSIIGIWPIKTIDNKSYKIGSLTEQIQVWLNQIVNEASCAV